MKHILRLLATILLLAGVNLASAQAPANDNFTSAAVLTTNVTSTINNASATIEAGDPANSGYRTLWYRYTAPARGVITISTPRGPATGYSHQVVVYRGNALNALNYVASGLTYSNSGYVSVSFLAEAGMEFRVMASCLDRTDSGNLSLTALETGWPYGSGAVLAPQMPTTNSPTNNDIASADVIPNTNAIITAFGYNVNASLEPGESNGYRSLWYSYTTRSRSIVTITSPSQNRVAFSHSIIVYQGNSLSNLHYVNGQLTYSSNGSVKVSFPAEAGVEYKLVFASVDSSDSGTAVFSIQEDAWPFGSNFVLAPRLPVNGVPANNNYAEADIVPNNVGAVTIFGYSADATLEAGESGSYNTLWYNYTVPADGNVRLQVVLIDYYQTLTIKNADTGASIASVNGYINAKANYENYFAAGSRLQISLGSQNSGNYGPFVFNLTHTPGTAGGGGGGGGGGGYVNSGGPTTRITFPRNNSTVSRKGTLVNATGYDDDGIALFDLKVNGKHIAYDQVGGRAPFTKKLRGKKATIEVRSQDKLGVWGPFAKIRVKVK